MTNLSNQLWIWLGLAVCLGIPFGLLVVVSGDRVGTILDNGWFMLAGSIICYAVTSVLLDRTLRYPGRGSSLVSIPLTLVPILVLIAVIALGRIYYSRPYLICFGSVMLAWMFLRYQMQRRPSVRALATLPFGQMELLESIKGIRFVQLRKPVLPNAQLDGIVLDMHAQIPQEWISFIADQVMQQKRIYHVASLVESMAGLVSLEHVAALHLEDLRPSLLFNPIKRGVDISVSLLGGLLLLPLGLLVAVLIRLESKGPALYRQERVGFQGKNFMLLKFRSMRVDAEAGGAQFTVENDPRITRMGRFIRKTRLDELPQLWNVVRGEMSLVGPRPERAEFVDQFEQLMPGYNRRHDIPPGITGLAQIRGRYQTDPGFKLGHDLQYIVNWSPILDLMILAQTVAVMARRSAR